MTDIFNDVYPYYRLLGMSYEEFWDYPPILCRQVRKTHELETEKRNQEMWWQGYYNYVAFSSVMAMFSWGLNGKKGKKPDGYLTKPIPITEHEKEVDRQEKIKHTMDFVKKGQKNKNGGT